MRVCEQVWHRHPDLLPGLGGSRHSRAGPGPLCPGRNGAWAASRGARPADNRPLLQEGRWWAGVPTAGSAGLQPPRLRGGCCPARSLRGLGVAPPLGVPPWGPWRSQGGGGHFPTEPPAAAHPALCRLSVGQCQGQNGAGQGAGIPRIRALPGGCDRPDLGTLDPKQTAGLLRVWACEPLGQRNRLVL